MFSSANEEASAGPEAAAGLPNPQASRPFWHPIDSPPRARTGSIDLPIGRPRPASYTNSAPQMLSSSTSPPAVPAPSAPPAPSTPCNIILPLDIQGLIIENFLIEHEKRMAELEANRPIYYFPHEARLPKKGAPNRQISQLCLVSRWWCELIQSRVFGKITCDSLEMLLELLHLTEKNPRLSTYTRELSLRCGDWEFKAGIRAPKRLSGEPPLKISQKPTILGQFEETVIHMMKQWESARGRHYRPLNLSVTYYYSESRTTLPSPPSIHPQEAADIEQLKELDDCSFRFIESLTIASNNVSHSYMRKVLPPEIHPCGLLKLTRSENLRRLELQAGVFGVNTIPITSVILQDLHAEGGRVIGSVPRHEPPFMFVKSPAILSLFNQASGPPKFLREADLVLHRTALPNGTPDTLSTDLRRLSTQLEIFKLWTSHSSPGMFFPLPSKTPDTTTPPAPPPEWKHMREFSVTLSNHTTDGEKYIRGQWDYAHPSYSYLNPSSIHVIPSMLGPLILSAITALVHMPKIEFWELAMVLFHQMEEETATSKAQMVGTIRVVVGSERKVRKLEGANSPGARAVKAGEVRCTYPRVFESAIRGGEVEALLLERWPEIEFKAL